MQTGIGERIASPETIRSMANKWLTYGVNRSAFPQTLRTTAQSPPEVGKLLADEMANDASGENRATDQITPPQALRLEAEAM